MSVLNVSFPEISRNAIKLEINFHYEVESISRQNQKRTDTHKIHLSLRKELTLYEGYSSALLQHKKI